MQDNLLVQLETKSGRQKSPGHAGTVRGVSLSRSRQRVAGVCSGHGPRGPQPPLDFSVNSVYSLRELREAGIGCSMLLVAEGWRGESEIRSSEMPLHVSDDGFLSNGVCWSCPHSLLNQLPDPIGGLVMPAIVVPVFSCF